MLLSPDDLSSFLILSGGCKVPFPPDIIACLEFRMVLALEVEQEEEELEEAGRLEQACPQRSPEP